MSSFDSIPIVDFSCMSLDTTTTTRNNAAFHQLAQEIHTAFSTVGFVYLKNTGISDAKVQKRYSTLMFDILNINVFKVVS